MNNNLPVEVKRGILRIPKEKKEKIVKVAKAIGYAGIVTAGMGMAWIGGPTLLGLMSLPAFGVGTIGFAKNTVVRVAKDSLFGIRQGSKTAHIEQVSLGLEQLSLQRKVNKMFKNEKTPTIQKYKKGGLMALQTLMMLQREKEILENNPKIQKENGIYSKKYQTVTHGINIDNMKLLDQMGYIKIENDSVKKESYLIFERLGFGQRKDVANVMKAIATRNKEEKQSLKKEMHTLDIKITDKPIDIKELYDLYNNNKKQMKRFQAIFGKNGILSNSNIDIQKDQFGKEQLIYDAKKSFIERIEEEYAKKKIDEDIKNRIDVRDSLTYEKQVENMKQWEEKSQQNLNDINNQIERE